MNCYKMFDNNYIIGVGTSTYKTNSAISDEEYRHIMQTVQTKPTAPDGYDYRLRTDLTWELYELPKEDEESE